MYVRSITARGPFDSLIFYPPGRMSEAIPLGVHLIFLFFICTSICTPKPIGLYEEEEDPDKKVL